MEHVYQSVTARSVPQHSFRRLCDKFRSFVRMKSVASYLSEFRNIVFVIPALSKEREFDRFHGGMGPQVCSVVF